MRSVSLTPKGKYIKLTMKEKEANKKKKRMAIANGTFKGKGTYIKLTMKEKEANRKKRMAIANDTVKGKGKYIKLTMKGKEANKKKKRLTIANGTLKGKGKYIKLTMKEKEANEKKKKRMAMKSSYFLLRASKETALAAYLADPPPANATHQSVLGALRSTKFSGLVSRQNTRLNADSRPEGMCLGALKSWCKGVGLSSATLEHTHLTRLCCDFIRKKRPSFRFTSIQVNKNYRSALHVDNGNLGPSFIYGLGAWTRGGVYIHGSGIIDVHSQWHEFDGNVPHATCPFEGERYTLIFFTNQSCDLMPAAEVEQLKQIGFHWPDPGTIKPDYGPKALRMDAARDAMPSKLKHLIGKRDKGKSVNSYKGGVTASLKQRNLETKLKRQMLRSLTPEQVKKKHAK